MSKITDPDYRLPYIYPQLFNDEFNSSANKPILISGIDTARGTKDDYVVKLKKAERMSEEASMRELLASFLAMQLDVNIVNPAVIEIIPEFVELLKGNNSWAVANKSLGYNYGSLYLKDYRVLLLNQSLNDKQLSFAQNIFSFDIFIQNSDRTVTKPNMLTNGEEVVALDHEVAFGFIFAPFLTPLVWEMQENHKDWIRNHCLLPLLKGKHYDFEQFAKGFENLTDQFWERAWELTPTDWRNDQFHTIRETLSRIISQKESFILELKKILS